MCIIFSAWPAGPSIIENDAQVIEKLLLKTQVSENFLHIEVILIIQYTSIIVQGQDRKNNISENVIRGQGEKFSANLRETRDKRLLGRDPDRSWCYRHTTSMIKFFCRSPWLHGHRWQHTSKVKSSRPSLQPTLEGLIYFQSCWCYFIHFAPWFHGHRRQHTGKVKSSRPSLEPTLDGLIYFQSCWCYFLHFAPWFHGHRWQHTGKVKSSRPSL